MAPARQNPANTINKIRCIESLRTGQEPIKNRLVKGKDGGANSLRLLEKSSPIVNQW